MKYSSIIQPIIRFFSKLNINNLRGGQYYSELHRQIALFPIIIFLTQMLTPPMMAQSSDTLVCDNGGFESDFVYYSGATTVFDTIINGCTPYNNGNSVIWNVSSLPAFRGFKIVTNGLDSLVGINRTKFGNKALLLNDRYSQTGDNCQHTNGGVNKIIKRFKVTEENRDFTVWFAVVLENPTSGHFNEQPWFNIKCDRAPASELCFDANILKKCGNVYSDTVHYCTFDTINVLDWSCHRIKIPKNMVDSIATLEIIAGDCGQSIHFGYAYIDGICEDCTSNALGSATLYDQDLDGSGLGIAYNGCLDTITFCGSYTLPTICGNWRIDSIRAPGYTLFNIHIDTSNHTFCFDIPLYVFTEECKDLYAAIYFNSTFSHPPPVLSNSIEICPGDYEKYQVDVYTGICQNNATDDLLSDDYYYVQVDLTNLHGDTFTVERQLDDPYPNESGHSVIKTGNGDGTYNLGPFFIQEGSWMLTIKFEDCIDTFYITPPDFCSACLKFRKTSVSNITCNDHGTYSVADDTWTFDLFIPGNPSLNYKVNGAPYSYNSNHTINVGIITKECILVLLKDENTVNQICESKLIICPPKPCSNETQCELEVSLKEISCNEEGDEFYLELDSANVGSGYLCYTSFAFNDPGNTSNFNYYHGNFGNPLGPFNSSIYIILSICSTSSCDCESSCFKVIYFPKPDCENLDYRTFHTNYKIFKDPDLNILPNPTSLTEFSIISSMKETYFELYNSSMILLKKTKFHGTTYNVNNINIPGIYIIKYLDTKGCFKYIKLMKL